jgi:hypothetical protein
MRRDPSTASPMVTVALYRDLVEDKGLALIRADFLPSVKRQVFTISWILLLLVVISQVLVFVGFLRRPRRC